MKIHSLPRTAIDQRQWVTWPARPFGICDFFPDRLTLPAHTPTVSR